MKFYTNILPKMDVSQVFEVKDFICPECGKSAIGKIFSNTEEL